jgi:hypothetical protein
MIVFNARNKPLENLPTAGLTAPSLVSETQLSNETDYNENPLKCPLDLGALSELGQAPKVATLVDTQLDRIVRKFKPDLGPKPVSLLKAKPDLTVFRKLSKADRTMSPDNGGKVMPPPAVQFVSPFRRYQLLKPYLDSIEQQEQRAQQQQQQKERLDTKPNDVDLR